MIHKHPINSYTQETRCGPGVKIDFLWVQEGDGMLQPHLVAVTVFVHSGLPAQPSGLRVRFGKTTSESAEESCRHDSATEWKQQIKLSQVFQRSPGTNRLSQQRSCRICRNDYKCVVIFNRPLRSVILSASACCHPPLAIIQMHTNPRSFHGFKPSFCLVKSGLKWRHQPATVRHGPYLGHRDSPPLGIRWLTWSGA